MARGIAMGYSGLQKVVILFDEVKARCRHGTKAYKHTLTSM